jgi:hypothetical protein
MPGGAAKLRWAGAQCPVLRFDKSKSAGTRSARAHGAAKNHKFFNKGVVAVYVQIFILLR